MSWRTCEILLWCFLVATFWSLIWNPLLIVPVSFQLLFFIRLLSVGSLEFDLFVESWLVCWCFFDTFTDYFSITDLNLVSDCRWLASTGFHQNLLLQITCPCCFDLFDGSCRVCCCFFDVFRSLIFDHWFEVIVFSSIGFNSLFHLWFFPLRIISTFFWCFAECVRFFVIFSGQYILICDMKPALLIVDNSFQLDSYLLPILHVPCPCGFDLWQILASSLGCLVSDIS